MLRLLPILFLSSLAFGDILYTKERIVIVQNRRDAVVHKGRTFYRADTFCLWQADFFRDFICQQWLSGFDLWDFAQFARVYVPIAQPWQQVGISKERYEDWLATGDLKTEEEWAVIQAAKEAEEQKRIADVMAEIANIKFYLSPDGVWHTTKDCIDCVKSIEVGPFDVMKIPGVKSCPKCGVK